MLQNFYLHIKPLFFYLALFHGGRIRAGSESRSRTKGSGFGVNCYTSCWQKISVPTERVNVNLFWLKAAFHFLWLNNDHSCSYLLTDHGGSYLLNERGCSYLLTEHGCSYCWLNAAVHFYLTVQQCLAIYISWLATSD